MKQSTKIIIVLLAFIGITSTTLAQDKHSKSTKQTNMKTYVIEREIPNAASLTPEQLKSISQTSCGVLKQMGPKIEWLHSYVAGDKIYCIYKAENEALIREHAQKGGFPANKITEVAAVISPATAD